MRRIKMVMRILACLLVGLIISADLACCTPPYRYVLVDEEGEQVRVVMIRKIITDEDLTDDEKRELLRDVGLTDELFIDSLIDNPDSLGEQEFSF
jgi:hypothetical protein